MKYIIISTKTPKEMEDLLNSKYQIESLGNTWVTNGNIYQSFLGATKVTKELYSAKQSVKQVEVPKVTKDTPVTKKDRPVETKAPKKKRKGKANVPDVSK
mgnify:CR=1 FL=1